MISRLTLWLVTKVVADGPQPIAPTGSNSTDGNASGVVPIISGLSGKILEIMTLIAGILALLYLIWQGIQYITAGGNQEKTKLARQGVINAIIGIIIIVAAYAIIRFATTIGTTITNIV